MASDRQAAMIAQRARPLVLGSLVVLLVAPQAATAKPSAIEEQRSCRAATAKNSKLMIGYALRALDACHQRSNEGKQTGDCNALADPSLSQSACQAVLPPPVDETERENSCRGVFRANAGIAVTFACQVSNPVLQNYPPSAITGSGASASVALANNVLGPVVLSTVGASGAQLQRSGAASQKGARSCENAIGRVRSRIVRRGVGKATACQKAMDRRSTSFAAIDPSCLEKAGGPFTEEMQKLRKACRRIDGASVGSCADLPGCVRDSAIATGKSLARMIYGGPTVCGNGVVELGEACDDGNTDNTDACTTTCKPAVCGDGFVEAGVEECDDGNFFNTDACLNDCKVPACGDGMVNGSEECDDGNTDPNDGCVNCMNAFTCSGPPVTADVQLFDPSMSTMAASNLAGCRLDLGYPTGLSIPGSGVETDDTRVTDLTGLNPTIGFFDRDDSGDGIDDTARLVFAVTGSGRTFGQEPIVSIQFDCAPGTPISLTAFNCVVLDAANPVGTTVNGIVCKVVSVQ